MDIMQQDFLVYARAFHFLRPEWLVALVLIAAGWFWHRRDAKRGPSWTTHIAPHLLAALTINSKSTGRAMQAGLVAAVLACLTFATAGPAWKRIPNPFVSETAPLVVVLDMSELMYANDIQPSRLERAKMKVRDLVALRAGARTALVAYAGTAHLVLPPSEDPDLIQPFLDGLTPEIMPKKGRDATAGLTLAVDILKGQETPGSMVFVTGGVDERDLPAFRQHFSEKPAAGVSALILGTDKGGPVTRPDGTFVTGQSGERVIAAVKDADLKRLRDAGVSVVRAGVGNKDIVAVERQVASNLQAALNADSDADFEDMGWMFVWPAALLCLLWFRKGWTFRLAIALASTLLVFSAPEPSLAQSDGTRSTRAARQSEVQENSFKQTVFDWFFTRDQQGRFAYEKREYSKAGDLFTDPMWKGAALYEAGRYEDAAAAFANDTSAWGLFNRGNALVKARTYVDAIPAYEQALKEDPDNPVIRHNLEAVRNIIAYLERAREQSDRGAGAEVDGGADAVVFDKQSDEGFEYVIDDKDRLEIQSTEKWMRAVDTRSADFLRTKFALEAYNADKPTAGDGQ